MSPKVFISYCWGTVEHQRLVKSWADMLIADGIEVIIDIYDLKEGFDKYVFMEKMVNDESITNVLIICDKEYTEKANARKAGVGTESQIISKEIYEKTEQSKFIPVVCEFDDDGGNAFVPVYLHNRIWINFSTPELVNKNWESLVRVIYGKPLNVKPALGKIPVYITNDEIIPTNNIQVDFNYLKGILLQDKPGIKIYRERFLNACFEYADKIKTIEYPDKLSSNEIVLEDAKKLKLVRNYVIDWILLEGNINKSSEDFSESIIEFLEQLWKLKIRPPDPTLYRDEWFIAQAIFLYETFLYVIAALIKIKLFKVLNSVLKTKYLIPSNNTFDTFHIFYDESKILEPILAPEGKKLISSNAEYIKINSDREDLKFNDVMEADLLLFMMGLISKDEYSGWYPQTLNYAPYGGTIFPLFIKATQHRYFLNLAKITGIDDSNKLKIAIKEAFDRDGCQNWYISFGHNLLVMMNLDKIDTIE